MKSTAIFLTAFCLVIVFSGNIFADDKEVRYQTNVNFFLGAEYVKPGDSNRQIRSAFLYGMIGKEFVNFLHYSLYGGITATYARGNIIQWDDNLHDVKYDTAAAGIGPGFMIKVDFLRFERFYFSGDFLFGVIFYNTNFPPGGDIYNFFRKYGVSIGFIIDEKYSFNIGIRNSHVSNGKGLGPQNPSYDGVGISAEIIKKLW